MTKKNILRNTLFSAAAFIALLITSCDSLVGLGDVVDITAPELQITSPAIEPMAYMGNDFTITGTVSDDIGVAKVLVSWPGLEQEAVIDGTDWSITVPFSSITDLGPVVFKAVATDTAGKETLPVYRTVAIDNTPPTVLVTAPQVYNPGPSNSNYIVLGGELWDSSPVNYVRIEIIDPASPATPVLTQPADGDRLWSARIEFDSSFVTGKEYLYRIVAEDAAGNINKYQYHSADFWTRLSSGESFPVMSDIGGWDQYGDTLSGFTNLDKANMQVSHVLPDLNFDFVYNSDIDIPVISLSNLDKDEPVAANNSLGQSVPIYASATDDKEGIDRDSVNLNVTGAGLDLNIAASEFTSPGDGLYTSFQFDLSGANILDPGPYLGTLTLTDNKGVGASLAFSFLINKGAPSIISLNPSSTYAPVDGSGNLNIEVVFADDNPDAVVSAVASDTDGNPLAAVTSSVLVAEHLETINGEDVFQSTHTLTLPGPVPDDVTVEVLVTDNSGVKSSRTVNYTIDRDNPDVVISVPSDGDIISGTALTTAGTSSDTGSDVFNVEVFVSPGNLTEPPADAVWLNAEGNTSWTLPVDLSSGGEGYYTIFAKSFDAAGNEGAFVFSNFYYDQAVPSITMDGGTSKEYKSADYTLSGTLADSNGLVELTVFSAKDGGSFTEVSGSPFAESGTTGSWSLPVTVDGAGADDGLYEYEFIITDAAGKTSTLSKTVIVDTTSPDLIVSNLNNGDSVNTSSYTILGLASDFSGIQGDRIQYSLNGGALQNIDVERTGNWELNVSGLAEGSGNSIILRADDILGNSVVLSPITFGLDLNPPALTITGQLALDGTFAGSDFTVSGTTSDVNGIDHMEISTDGGLIYNTLGAYNSSDNTVLNWTTTVTIPADGSEDGNHVVRVKTVDTYNKETIESFSINYDATAPVLNFSNISDAMLVTVSPFLVNGTSSDNGGSGVSEVLYSFDNLTWNSISGTVDWSESVPFTLGLNSDIYFKTVDAVNNESAVETITLNIDLQLPETDGNWAGVAYRDSAFTLTGTATDDLGVASVTVTGEGVGVIALDGNNGDASRAWSVPVTPSADGTYEYSIRVTDTAGRYQDFSRTAAYDTTAPELLVANLSEGDSVETNSYTIRGTATDASGIVSVEYNLNSGGWLPVTGLISWSQDVTGLSEGAGNSIQFQATDSAGHVTTLPALNFGLDLNPPALTVANKAAYDGTWQNSTFTLSGTSTDANGIDTVEISTDGGSTYATISGFTGGDPDWTADVFIPVDGSEDGNHLIKIKAIDSYDKETVDSLTVKYDTTGPTFFLSNLVDNQQINSSPFTLLGSWSDNGGSGTETGSADVEYTLNGGTDWFSLDTLSASAFAHSFVLGETLNQSIGFRAIDHLGNLSAETTVTGLIVDTAIPDVDETTLATSVRVLENGTLSMSGTASDTHGLASVKITATKDSVDQGELYNEAGDLENWGPYTLGTGNDGLWIFTITATDVAGRPVSVLREVEMDSTVSTATVSSVPATLVNDGASFSFEGNSADAGSGVEAVRIAFAADGTGSQLAAGKTTWSAIVDLPAALGTEGTKTLYVQVEDKAGNLSPWTATQQAFVYDTAGPVTLLTEDLNRDVNGDFSLNGTASDNYGIASVTITQSKDGGADIPVSVNGPSGTAAWSLINLPRNPADIGAQDLSDGTYVYKLISTDSAGKSSTEIVSTVRLDQTAPEILTVTNPGAGQTGLNSLSGGAFTYSGTSSDSGVGMSKIYYLIDQNAAASTSIGDYAELTTTGNWSFTDDFDTDHSGADTGRSEGTWYIHVLAEDTSGNRTAFGSAVTVEFDIDQAPPTLTEDSSGIPGSAPVYRNADINLSGTAADATGISSVFVSYSKDGAGAVELLNDTTDDGSWSTTVGTALGDGDYEVSITASDAVGKSTTLTRNIVIDTSSPDLTVESPVENELVDTDSYSLSGKISDNGGVGVTELQYSRDNTGWTDITMTGFSWEVAGLDFSSPVGAEAAQGSRTLYVRTTDGLNGEVVKTINFNYDTADPVLTETAVNVETEQITSSAVLLSGVASDTNALAGLTVSYDNGLTTTPVPVDADGADDIPGNSDDNTWTYTHPNSADGVFALQFTATDASGRTTTVKRNILTDNTAPAAPVISSSPGNYVTSSLSLTGTAADAVSGIASVEYSFDNSTGWTLLSGTDNWFGVVNVTSRPTGSNTIYVRSTDRAGKVSTSDSQVYIIDRNDPVLTVNGYTGSVYTNSSFTIDGTMDDRDLGATPISISVELDGNPVNMGGFLLSQDTGTKTWSQIIPTLSGDGDYRIVVTATDAVGRTVSESRTVGVDTTAPTVAVSTDFTGWLDSNTVLVEGTAADAGSRLKVIQYSFNNADWTDLASSSPWSGYISIPSGDSNPLYIRSVDNVDNLSAVESGTVKIDTTGPVLSMVSPVSLVKLNGVSDLGIQVLAQDINQSGVISAKVKVNSTDFTTPDAERVLSAAAAEFNNTWSLSLPAAAVPVPEGQVDVNIQFEDVVGNTTIQSFPILIDRSAPTGVSIASHADNDTVNKLINVSGSASDSQGLDTVVLEIKRGTTAVWENLTVTGTYSWSADIDTETYDNGTYDTNTGTPETEIQLRLTASDAAGNATAVTRVLTIDQNSDRPVVTVNNLDSTGTDTLRLSQTIYGSVSDDDGVDTFEISEDNISWTPVALSGSSWQYDVSSANGTKNLYFRITDADGLTFATNEAEEPRLIGDSAGEIADTLTFRLDTITPEIYSVISADRLTPFDFVSDVQTVTTNMPFGGTSSHFAIKVLARDANTIDTVNINIPGLGDIAAVKGADELGYEVYTTVEQDISALTDGSVDMVITVTDDSGLSSTASRTILLDNTAPDITYLSPRSSLDVVNGDIPVRGLASDGGSALESVEYKVGYNYNDETWQAAGGSLFNWELDFSGADKTDFFAGLEVENVNTDGTISLTGHGYADDTPVWIGAAALPTGLSVSTTYYIVGSTADTFKLAASAGGTALTYAAVGSEVRISKYSKDSNGDSIWELPVIVKATDFAGNSSVVSDSAYVVLVDPSGDKPHPVIVYPDPDNPNRVMGGIIRIFGTAEDDDGVDSVYMQIDVDGDGDFDAADIDSESVDWYNGGNGRAVSGSASWNMNINSNGEFNPVTGTTPINFRVRVLDILGTYGPWSEIQHIDVDNSVPKIGSSEAPTLTKDSGATVQNYISDMYIRGDWTLEGTIEDESDISDIQITGDITGSLAGNPGWFTDYTGAGTTGYRMQIPVTTAGTGIHIFTVTATDNSDPKTSNSATFRINYDNTAPTMEAYNSALLPVEQSNKTYHLTSTVDEGGSGLERVAFFFLRQGATDAEDRIYNPMELKAGNANRTYLNHVYGSGSTLAFVDSMPRLILSGASRSDEYTLQHNDITGNTNVRKGGLIKIGGLDRLITAVDYGTGTISWSGAVSTGVTDASIAYALIVDHDIPETPVWNPDNTLAGITNDDGDGLIEELSKTGTEYVWDAYIDSKEIPDGPIEIHWVSFDKSGNYTADFVSTQVLNHRPMLASVLLGTDLNGANGVEAGEKVPVYSLLDGLGANQAVATSLSGSSDASPFTAKGETSVEIEVIGGNGMLQYEFFEGAGTTNIHGTLKTLRADDVSAVQPITVTTANLTSGEIGEGDKNLVFKIWDSTEETTIGVDSQWAQLTVPMTVDVIDEVAPMSVISPFAWTSETDNSIYNNDRTSGHIEISGVVDGTDPDVSGQVSVRGTAYDDQRIEELYIRIDDMTITEGTPRTFNSESYALVSEYNAGVWTSTGTLATDGWSFSAADISIDQTGHRISWQLDWDSSRITGVAGLNKTIKVVSVDKGGKNSLFTIEGTDADDTTYNVPLYGVDVVPYITDIKRNSTYISHRSRSGAYSLLRGEAVNTLTGFNLDTGGSMVLDTNKSGAAGTTVSFTGYTVDDDKEVITFDAPATIRSGWLRLVVNGVEAVNNLNSNLLDSNIESNIFLPETEFWNDDRYIRAWQSDPGDVFDQSDNPVYPTMDMATDGTLYASFSNYSDSTVYYSTLTANSRTPVFHTYDPAEETDLIVTGAGEVNVLYSANYHGGNTWNWAENVDDAGGLYLYDNNAPTMDPGRGNEDFYRFELFYHNEMLQQFKNLRGARGSNNIIHTAYYDRLSNSVKYANVTDGWDPGTNAQEDVHERPWVNLDGGSDSHDTGVYSGGSSIVLADQYENDLIRSTGTDEYLSITVDEDNYPLVVYSDAADGILRLARSNNTSPYNNADWSVQTIMSDTETEENYGLARDYYSAQVDNLGFLHIIFRNSRGELGYIVSTNNPENGAAYTFGTSITIDESGLWADLTLKGTTPYISYLSKVNAYDGIKIAFYDTTLNIDNNLDLDGDGVPENGGWETMTAAMDQKSSNIRTSVEAHPTGTGTNWTAAVGYTPGSEYRAVYYIGE